MSSEKDWTEEMPKKIGLWEIRCGETDDEVERVAITARGTTLVVHSEHLCQTHLKTFHDGLTSLRWRHIA